MLDFTSALYLGLRHGSSSLPSWSALTLGKPALLCEPPGARRLAALVAQLAGCHTGLLFPSTLHAFWDLFVVLGHERPTMIFWDDGAYPVARWGIERAAARGIPARSFRHHDPVALARCFARSRGRPIVVTDGHCAGCGRSAPLAEYLSLARAYGGLLAIDDTQALGILGSPDGSRLGYGGGGSLRNSGLSGSDIIWIASLAKGFGAPVAIVAGNEALVARLDRNAETRVHSSPPSVAAIAGGLRALAVNASSGETLRARLTRRICEIGAGLRRLGAMPVGRVFPVQEMSQPRGSAARELHQRLAEAGVQTVLRRPHCKAEGPSIAWVLNAAHSAQDVKDALTILARTMDSARITALPSLCE